MNRDLRAFLPALLAALLLATVAAQTFEAFQRSGRWNPSRKRAAVFAADPLSRLERLLSLPDQAPPLRGLRDPFDFGHAPVVVRPAPGPSLPGPAPTGSRPVLTALVSDPQDPQAVIVYENRSPTERLPVAPEDLLIARSGVLAARAAGVRNPRRTSTIVAAVAKRAASREAAPVAIRPILSLQEPRAARFDTFG